MRAKGRTEGGAQAEQAYTDAKRALEKAKRAPEQDEGFTIEDLRKLDGAATTQVDIETTEASAQAWWLLLRLDELEDIICKDCKHDGQDACRFTIPKSKTDQASRGVTTKMICYCKSKDKAAKGFKNIRFCPIHAMPKASWEKAKNVNTATWRIRLNSLMTKAGITYKVPNRRNAIYNLHSCRRGGAQAACISMGAHHMRILGRWKSDSADEYEQDCLLNPPGGDIPKTWPMASLTPEGGKDEMAVKKAAQSSSGAAASSAAPAKKAKNGGVKKALAKKMKKKK